MFLGFTSLGAAFVPGCPFRSAFSELMLFIFEKLQALSKLILGLKSRCLSSSKSSKWLRWLWIGILTIFWLASDAAVAYATLKDSTWFSLFFFSSTIPIAYVSQLEPAYKPQKYRILSLATCVFLFVTLLMFLAVWFKSYESFIPLFVSGVIVVALACVLFSKMSKSMARTGEIDAIAWLLITTPPKDPATFFKKAGRMAGSKSSCFDY